MLQKPEDVACNLFESSEKDNDKENQAPVSLCLFCLICLFLAFIYFEHKLWEGLSFARVDSKNCLVPPLKNYCLLANIQLVLFRINCWFFFRFVSFKTCPLLFLRTVIMISRNTCHKLSSEVNSLIPHNLPTVLLKKGFRLSVVILSRTQDVFNFRISM